MDIMSFSQVRADRLSASDIDGVLLFRDNPDVLDSSNLEFTLRTTQWILDKVRSSEVYAHHLYAALCNNRFQQLEVIPILKNQTWACSWRYAGGIIANMLQRGDYTDWFCSFGVAEAFDSVDIVTEGTTTAEVARDLRTLGWVKIDDVN